MASNNLGVLFTKMLQDVLNPSVVIPHLVAKRLKNIGIELSEAQLQELAKQVTDSNLATINLELSEDQESVLIQAGMQPLSINLDDADISKQKIEEIIGAALLEFLDEFSPILLDNWKSKSSFVLSLERGEQAAFLDTIDKTWGKIFDLFEMLASVCLHLGAEANSQLRQVVSADDVNLVEAITRIHARGCQVTGEIITLLRNGFADGAHARWRTLHELTVTAQFIAQYGNDLAKAYLDYSVIISHDLLTEYVQHYQTLGYEAPDNAEMDHVNQSYESMIQKYGKSFKKDYGWASSPLNDNNPNFSKIEKAVNVNHMRPFYKLANMNIHADSRSILFRLSMHPNDQVLVAGRSNLGLADPIQNAAYSLNNLTGALLLIKPTVDRLAQLSATTKMVEEIFAMVDVSLQE